MQAAAQEDTSVKTGGMTAWRRLVAETAGLTPRGRLDTAGCFPRRTLVA